MSKCMTIDETIDQKEICAEINVKDIVEFILEEALNAADLVTEKDCSHIGDFNITEDFCQQFDQIQAYPKDLEISKLNLNGNSSTANQEINLDSGESIDRSISILTARENLELILDSFIKRDDKAKNLSECKVISEEILADNELRIENGQIRIKNKPNEENKSFLNESRIDYFYKKDVIKDEKIEIEYFNDGKLNKIYVPLNKVEPNKYQQSEGSVKVTNEILDKGSKDKINENEINEIRNNGKAVKRPFAPCTTEELRQVWGNTNSSVVGGWNGDMSAQSKDVVRLMVELSSAPVFEDISTDPNRPRACAFAEEDVKKMTKEIEDINFNQTHLNLTDIATACRSDGKGDSVLESKRFANNNEENLDKQLLESKKESSKRQNNIQNESLANISNVDSKQILRNENTTLINSTNFFENSNNFDTENQKNEIAKNSNSSSNSVVSVQQTLTNVSPSKQQNGSFEDGDELTVSPTSHIIFTEEKTMKNKNPRVICSTSQNAIQFHFQQNIDDKSSTLLFSPAGININPSQTEIKETENLSKDYSIHENITLHSLKESSGETSTFEMLSEDQDTLTFENRKKESLHKNYYPLAKVSEVLLPEISPAMMKDEEKLSEITHADLRQDDLSLNKNDENDIAGIEKVNEMNYDSSYDYYVYPYKSHTDLRKYENTNFEYNSSFMRQNEDMRYSSFIEFPKEDNKKVNYYKANQIKCSQTIFNENLEKESINYEIREEFQEKDFDAVTVLESGPSQLCSAESALENDLNSYGNVQRKNFKLHSQKMYFGATVDPVNSDTTNIPLTHSEEAFIDLTENVIQVIEPPEFSTEEVTKKVSFSLYHEIHGGQSLNNYNFKKESDFIEPVKSSESLMESNIKREASSEDEIVNKKVYSGMTTIGPIKNINHDPKDLTAVDIDYGKMTRITSSRQITKDFFGVEIKSAPSVKITVDDSDEESLNLERRNIENATLVNRDIASLTKVQKVREVMSHHPRSDDDFEDDDNLTRPRLDLKDVESMTDERCKVPDVSIQLLSFEVGENNPEVEQEFIQNVNLVLSRNHFDDFNYENDPNNIRTQKNDNITEINYDSFLDLEKRKDDSEHQIHEKISPCVSKNENFTFNINSKINSNHEIFINSVELKNNEEINLESTTESQFAKNPSQHKCSTLGSVFKKASSKLIKKDDDFVIRNSKSLPRDNKVAKAESVKVAFDDCHISASNMLKKSHSLLKNTQEIFKTISQNRFTCHRSATNLNKNKLTPSELDIRNPERKSSFIKKEDFLKAKQAIKDKMEKAFKNLNITPRSESEGSLGKKEFEIKNDESPKINQIENFKKFLPKSPLIYKSQFVKSQINVQRNTFENNESSSPLQEKKYEAPQKPFPLLNENSKISVSHSDGVATAKNKTIEKEAKTGIEKKENDHTFWIHDVEYLNKGNETGQQEQQPEFIVMETVQGISTNLENSSYLKEKSTKNERVQFLEEIGSEDKFMSAHSVTISDSKLQVKNDNFEEKSSQMYNNDKDKCQGKIHAEKKVRTKSKKFTARFRSFLYSAFGRVKTSSRNARNHS